MNGGARALARAALALPEGRRGLRRPARGHLLHPLAHAAAAARRDPGPRHAPPRRLASRPRKLLELRAAGPARAAHGEDAAARDGRALPRGKKPQAPASLAPEVAAAMAEVRKAARQATTLNTMFWRDHRSDRLKSLETSRAEMREFKSWLDRDGPAAPAGRAHGERGPHPSRPARPRVRARGGGLAGGREVPGRRARRHGARGRPRRGHLPVQPALRAVQEARGAVGPRGEGAGALRCDPQPRPRHPKRRKARCASSSRTTYGRSRSCASGGGSRSLADSRLLWIPLQLALKPEQHDTQQELDAILSRAQGTPLVGGNLVFYWNGQQWQLTLHRSILAARDYHVLWLHDFDGVDHGGDADSDQLLHHGRGLPEGAHRARARVRHDRQAPRVHDPGGPQLLGSEQGPPVHRRAAGPAARPAEAAAAGRRAEPQDAGRRRARARRAARGGRGLEAAAGGSVPARPGLAAEVRLRAPERDEPGGLLVPHEPPDRLPADRAGHHRARPPQDHLLRRDRARPRQGRRDLRRRRRGGAVRLRHLGGPRGAPGGPGGAQRQGRGAPLPEGERLHGTRRSRPRCGRLPSPPTTTRA